MNKLLSHLDTLYHNDSVTRGLYVAGEAGNSKSWQVENYLKNNNVNYEKVTARVTSLALYFLLYKHNGKTILLDDIAIDKAIAIDLLKSALNPDGLVSWHTSSESFSEDVPSSFEFTGKIIVITNEGINESRLFYPLLSRCYFLEQNLSLDEYLKITNIMCEKRGVESSLITKHISKWLKHRDLRIINKAIDFILAGELSLLSDLFNEDEELKKLDELNMQHEDKRTIRMIWCSIFDKSKRTFYTRLKEYKEKTKSAEVQPKKDVV